MSVRYLARLRPGHCRVPLALALTSMVLAGCATTLAPRYERPAAPVSAQWPIGESDSVSAPSRSVADTPWQALFADPGLRGVVELALDNNRDLRAAALNIERARAQYRIQRSELLPDVGVGVAGNSGRTPAPVSATGASMVSHAYSADLGISAWELDLFGRLRSLEEQALRQFLATEATGFAVRTSLIAEVASAYLALAADTEQLALARETFRSRQEAYELQRQRYDIGSASDLELRQSEAEQEAARDLMLALESAVAIDRNALELLVGTPVPAGLHPAVPLESMLALQDIPAGLPSDLLQRRPDILAAEHVLIGANANIGAARAAFFPSISLTAGVGRASDSLSSLFDGGNRAWNFAPRINLPIFSGGRLRAQLAVSGIDRDIAVADYERSIQVAFREVADALALRSTLEGRLSAQQRQVEAAQGAYRLVSERQDNGVSSYLEVLDAQRTLYVAQQNQIATRLARQANLVVLYKALGGGWDPIDAAAPSTARTGTPRLPQERTAAPQG
ncbi:efflux transporter outer membrane subunit [Xanthomonas hortorum]|uniref:Efflux transporter outer membrane subunit n=1 Tax=Xanthomonas hortorum pv. hederae TaxID=453603 RepID=A0A9X4BQU1_9XANT|nr:efflux transporter outer membrane subunit [Xanthomonas hortorum]MCE4369614.1 efflux transporter outer membrane subunit [Xanthomonas hortorum pv. hederae]MDC8637112.1 efflux transporter outer membrane subunit [Xanthomonas hortorum pv. hederae]PPU86160.1 multidrug transporter [Xanthomonas hortorum pv. hederae]PUF01224.1 multidrug transporter [Xanthomonas hortorum pv. hederae]